MTWTDERVEQLKKLWSDGLSASQIAAELGGISVLVNGALFAEGSVAEISSDARVRAVYLGESVDE